MTKILSLFNSEYDLAKALQKQDPKAQTRLYEKYSSKMLAVCMRYVGDRMEAEDVMIEGFMRIFDKIGQFNFQGSFEGWIRRIMVNEALMYVRSRKVMEVDLEYATEEIDESSFSTDVEAEDLMKIINALPTGYRTVFNLYAIEGYSHAEIAEMLGISEGTSKSQLSRARVMLQTELQKLAPNPRKGYYEA
ncbi:MAG: sigma-70 family RNA polymerase sigma factor [Spirosomaceae bacterium]|jgi:RNA polymerase sigma-70 factor (ECF subfamily)|nr:sigma-70 family RNA polymerase sigma factor [Spirosomataceae bacterium]